MINISKVQYIFHNSRVFEQASVKKKKKEISQSLLYPTFYI